MSLLPSISVLLAAIGLPSPAAAVEPERRGTEFQVNLYTANDQNRPSVAASAAGDFVVAWGSTLQDGASAGVFARRFASTGAPLATEFQVNLYSTSAQNHPSVAASAAGDFVVAWQSSTQDGSLAGIFARRFASTGAALAGEFQVNNYTTSFQSYPAVAASSSGSFVVAWQSNAQDGSADGIFARRFSSSGAALATEFQVNAYTSNSQRYPSVAVDGDGDFVVAWLSSAQDGASYGVFAKRFSSAGAALAIEFQVNTYTLAAQRFPAVAASFAGDFVVVWASANNQDGAGYGIFARRFSSTGAALAAEFEVNAYSTEAQKYPAVAAAADGGFVVAWTSYGQDGSGVSIFARRFSSAGAALGADIEINTYTTGTQTFPRVAASASGDFVVAWQSLYQDGSDYGVFAQRFTAPRVLDIDDNGQVTALTDGLLVVRYLFGFTGTTLTAGAVGGGCNRCTGAAIEAYLHTLV